jgi:DNA-binding NarL/FixJ family response regulator
MRKIRVLVANRTRMMRDLVVETLSDQADIEIIGETATEIGLTELVDNTRPDAVIIALDDQKARLDLCGFLLGRYPEMRILAVSAELGNSICYSAFVDIRSKSVQTSEDGLLKALRNVTGPVGEKNEPASCAGRKPS